MFDPTNIDPKLALLILTQDVVNRLAQIAKAPEALSPDWAANRSKTDALKKYYRLVWSNRANQSLIGLLQDNLKRDHPTALAFDWFPCGYVAQALQIKVVALVPLPASVGTKSGNFSIRLSPAALAVVSQITQAQARLGKTLSRNEAIELALIAYAGPRCRECGTPLVALTLPDGGGTGFYECPECALGDEAVINPGTVLDYVMAKVEERTAWAGPVPE